MVRLFPGDAVRRRFYKAIDQLSDEKDESPKPAVVAFTVSKTAGEAIGLARQFVDAPDVTACTSQARVVTTAAYITFKFSASGCSIRPG